MRAWIAVAVAVLAGCSSSTSEPLTVANDAGGETTADAAQESAPAEVGAVDAGDAELADATDAGDALADSGPSAYDAKEYDGWGAKCSAADPDTTSLCTITTGTTYCESIGCGVGLHEVTCPGGHRPAMVGCASTGKEDDFCCPTTCVPRPADNSCKTKDMPPNLVECTPSSAPPASGCVAFDSMGAWCCP